MNNLITRFAASLILVPLSGVAIASESTVVLSEDALDGVTAGGSATTGLEDLFYVARNGIRYWVVGEGVYSSSPPGSEMPSVTFTKSADGDFQRVSTLQPITVENRVQPATAGRHAAEVMIGQLTAKPSLPPLTGWNQTPPTPSGNRATALFSLIGGGSAPTSIRTAGAFHE